MSMPLLPIAPILLLPIFFVAAVVGLPIWLAAIIVLGVLRLLVWPLERLVVALGSGTMRESEQLAAAFRWVLTFGGLTKRFKGGNVGSAGSMSAEPVNRGAGPGGAAPRA